MKKSLLFSLTFLILNITLWAQSIDSIKILPANPTTNNTIKVVAYTTFANTPCYLASSSINIIDSTITVYASHQNDSSMWPAFCNSIDTLTIGQLSAGTYELHYHLADTAPPTTYDIDTIIFTVQQSNGLQLTDNSEQKIKVYPNPFSTTTTIFIDNELLTSSLEIRMYDIFGREIKRMTKIKSKEITITRNNLTGGLYFIRVIREDKIIDNRKIIIN